VLDGAGNHTDGIASIDMFIVPAISFRIVRGLVVLRHSRRRFCGWV
jgi:hypothetical protein